MSGGKKLKSHYKWGIGLEHESYFFHFPLPTYFRKFKNPVESMDKQSEKSKKIGYWEPEHIIKDIILTPTEGPANDAMVKNRLENIPTLNREFFVRTTQSFEPTGRRCGGHVVLAPLPGTYKTYEQMPEFISGNPIAVSSRAPWGLEHYFGQLIASYDDFIDLLIAFQKDFDVRDEKYGSVIEYPFGMCSYIRVPENYKGNDYKFRTGLYTDYVGSYHITISLPFTKNTSTAEFIKRHQNFANMIQWLEPLLTTAYFSCNDRCMGTKKNLPRGSFRVLQVGWGNFAGTNVKTMAKGVGRYATTDSKWRKGMKFTGKETTDFCYEKSDKIKEYEPDAKSSFSTDIRTIGSSDHKTIVPMRTGYGIEIRIFDHFPTMKLLSLLRLVAYIAEHSRTHKVKEYVYDNKYWIKATQDIMMGGWSTVLEPKFIQLLRKNLGLKIATDSLIARNILDTINTELFERHKGGEWVKYLLALWDKYQKPPDLPDFNRDSWDVGLMFRMFNDKRVVDNLNKFLDEVATDTVGVFIEISKLKNDFVKFMGKEWERDFELIMYFFEKMQFVELVKQKNGTLNKIIFKTYNIPRIDGKILTSVQLHQYFTHVFYKNNFRSIIAGFSMNNTEIIDNDLSIYFKNQKIITHTPNKNK